MALAGADAAGFGRKAMKDPERRVRVYGGCDGEIGTMLPMYNLVPRRNPDSAGVQFRCEAGTNKGAAQRRIRIERLSVASGKDRNRGDVLTRLMKLTSVIVFVIADTSSQANRVLFRGDSDSISKCKRKSLSGEGIARSNLKWETGSKAHGKKETGPL